MKTLIVYATKSGATRKAAEMLAALMPDSTLCDLAQPVPALEGFDCVALGGGVRMGRWNKRARRFAERRAQELRGKRLGLFVCSAEMDKAREVLARQGLPEGLLESAVAVEGVGGEMEVEQLRGFEKLIVNMVSKQENNPFRLDGVRQERVLRFAQALLGTEPV